MDAALHPERTDRARRKVTYRAPVAGLPDGVMVRLADGPLAGRPGQDGLVAPSDRTMPLGPITNCRTSGSW
jgi:hypothetical protein